MPGCAIRHQHGQSIVAHSAEKPEDSGGGLWQINDYAEIGNMTGDIIDMESRPAGFFNRGDFHRESENGESQDAHCD